MIKHFCDRCERQMPNEGDRHSVSVEGDGKHTFGAFTLCSRCLTSLEQFFKEKAPEAVAR